MTYHEQEKAIALMKKAVKYVKMAYDEAETKHDSYGEYYMDSGLYDIIQDAEKLLDDMKEIINGFEDENNRPPWDGE